MTSTEYHNGTPGNVPAPGSDEALALLAARSPGSAEGRRAATELLRRYRLTVYRWCRRHIQDPEQAMDLTQEALLRVYRQMEVFDGRARFATWLFVITRNLCRSALRKPRLLRDEGVEPDALAGPDCGPDARLEEEESEEALMQLIRVHLDRREQDALWLRCIERTPVDVITRILAIEEKSGARAVLQSARRKLRAALAARNHHEGGTARE